jgi:hypothetical protein
LERIEHEVDGSLHVPIDRESADAFARERIVVRAGIELENAEAASRQQCAIWVSALAIAANSSGFVIPRRAMTTRIRSDTSCRSSRVSWLT